jgi:tetratricopeptide (TPR) repeat protein
MLDVQLFGLNPGAHHLVNVALHGANSVLLLLLLRRMTGALGSSAAVAALFAFHPLHVESVAWIAERKDLLSTLFGLATIHLYISFVDNGRTAFRIATLSCYCLSLMAKPMLVTLPLLLLILDYWPLKRFSTDRRENFLLAVEKLPFVAAMLLSSAVTLYAQLHGGAVSSLYEIPLPARISNALVSFCIYLGKMFWPTALAAFYPFPDHIPVWQGLLAFAFLTAITALAIRFRSRRPWLIAGWLWYLFSLIPVIGIIAVGSQARADRYTYLPFVGIFMAVVWLAKERLPGKWRIKQLAAVAIVGICCLITWKQIGYWRNSLILNRHALTVTGPNFIAENNLGLALDASGVYNEAIGHFDTAARIAPWFAKALTNKAETLRKTGRTGEGLKLVEAVLAEHPDDLHALDVYGLLLLQAGRPGEALAIFRKMANSNPDSADFMEKVGVAASRMGDSRGALEYFRRSLELNPRNEDALLNIALELESSGNRAEGGKYFSAALDISSRPALVHQSRGIRLRLSGDLGGAETSLRQAIRLEPGLASARSELATVLLLQKHPEEAASQFREAVRLAPDNPESRYNLGLLLAETGKRAEALEQLRTAARLRPEEIDYHFILGRELLLEGDRNGAAVEFAEVVHLAPGSRLASIARGELARIDRRP